ncbi:MAG: alpha/beta hydrolase [Actinobacteria bacterium]|nr:alpha/beta hydrolase [Actinomycetota bacterium]
MVARPAGPRLRWHRTTLSGRAAFYGEVGEGPPVVFLHGWGLTARAYAAALPTIARAGARVIAPALPGFGRSDELDGELTWRRLAAWIDRLLDHAGVDEPAFLIGHSFGGGVATMTAWHHPDRARSLVLVNSVGGSVWKQDGDHDRLLGERPWWDWGLRMPGEFTGRGYGKALPVVARDFLTNLVSNPRNLLRAGRLARRADLRDELRGLADRGLPVTILWGAHDRLLPEASFLATCEALGADGDVVADAGHSWLIADPDNFGEVITNSLTIHALMTRDRVPPRDR